MKEADVLDDLVVDTGNLISEMSQQPALFARYAFLSARCNDDSARLKFELATIEADVNMEVRDDYETKGKKVRESAIRAGINSDVRYQEANERYRNAKADAAILETAVRAFEMRAHMLSSIGALTRVEMEQNMGSSTPIGRVDPDNVNKKLKQKFNDLVNAQQQKGKKR